MLLKKILVDKSFLMCYLVSIMNETNDTNETLTFSVRMKPELNEKVLAYAEAHKWSRNFAINEILSLFLSAL